MYKWCGNSVQNLWTIRSITCQNLSTEAYMTLRLRKMPGEKMLVFRSIFPGFPLRLSTPHITRPPLFISSFTHNPQPLLLPTRMKN